MTSANNDSAKHRKWNIPLTYEPKIEPVRKGECTQTIRTGRKFAVGDLIRFYRWAGKPYRSKRETITGYMVITHEIPLFIHPWGIENGKDVAERYLWEQCDKLAESDGIVPPTGEALRDVLVSKNGKIPEGGIEAQIIRWRYSD